MKNSTKLIGAGLVATIIAVLYFKSKNTTPSNNGSTTTDEVTDSKGSNVAPKPIDAVTPPKGSIIAPKPIDVVPTNNNLQLAEQDRLARLAEIARLEKLAQSALAEKDRLEKARLLMLEQENLSLEQARLLVIKQAIEDAKIIAIQNSITSNPISGGGGGRGTGAVRGVNTVVGAITRPQYQR